MTTFDLYELLSACVDAAERAGKVIVKVQKEGNLGIKYKIEDDPVTIADIEAQKVIEATLGVGFEGLTIIGEEVLLQNELDTLRESTSPPDKSLVFTLLKHQVLPLRALHSKDIVVWVDPLDGTKCFVDGKYEWVTTLVGIAYKGTPIAGVISYPFTGELLWGAMGIGVFSGKDGERFYPPEEAYNPPQFFRAKGYYPLPSKYKNLNAHWRAMNTDYKSKYISGAGNVTKNILMGSIHALLSPLGGKWDTCAPEALLRVFGGKITSLKGELLNYHAEASRLNHDGFIATLVNHHRWTSRKKGKAESLSRQGSVARL